MYFFCVAYLIPVVLGNHFKSIPTTVKTHENDSVLLPCYLNDIETEETGGPAIRIQWFKDEILIGDTTGDIFNVEKNRFNIKKNGSLEVSNVEYGDTGEYICEIVRKPPWGNIRQIHAIEVLYPPSVKMIPDTGFLQVKLGEEVVISCAPSGVPSPIISWRWKGEELQLLDNRQVLKFEATNRFLSGEYECIASNGVGSPARAKTDVRIIYPPDIVSDKSWIHTSPGLRATIECTVFADPSAEVIWYKGNVAVSLDTRTITLADNEKHTLIIRNVRISDFGIYKCKAVNELGTSEAEVQLSGVANPAIFKKMEQKDLIKAKNSHTLVWEVDSYSPIIEYNLWFRPYRLYNIANKPDWTKLTIPAEHRSGPIHSKAYTLTGLKENSVYEAMLFSRNKYGWSKPSIVIKFTTEGTDLQEEVTKQMQIQDNIIPTDMTPESVTSRAHNLNLYNFTILVLIFCILIYFEIQKS